MKKDNQTNTFLSKFSLKHPKLLKFLKSNVKAFLITGVIIFAFTASAATVKIFHSRQVRYKDSKSVETAINELYEKADECYGYKIGDEITVNGINFYVIADSPFKQDYVVALKKEPLTVAEVNLYGGVGTEDNHVNKYTQSSVGTASGNIYGGMAFYTSENCGYVNGSWNTSNCPIDFAQSDIKYVIDNWSVDNFDNNVLKEIDGYFSRIISNAELIRITGKNTSKLCVSSYSSIEWLYNNSYHYWTMDRYYITATNKLCNSDSFGGGQYDGYMRRTSVTVRPVINVYKSAIQR